MTQLRAVFVLAASAAPWSTQAADAPGQCLIEARQMVEIRSTVDGAIRSLPVNRGDRVRKGQLVVEIDSSTEVAAAEVARARLEAQGSVEAAKAQLEFATRKLARVTDLYAQNAMSKAELEQADAEAQVARAQLRAAQDTQDVARHELEQAQTLIAQKRLLSPIDGVVVDRYQSVGELANRTSKQPILRLAQVDPLSVEVVRPVSEFGSIKAGQHATVSAEQPAGKSFTATVEVVDSVVDAASGTFGARLVLPNPTHAIPAGVKCEIHFSAGT